MKMRVTPLAATFGVAGAFLCLATLGSGFAQETQTSSSASSSSIECPTNASQFAPGKSGNQPPGQAKQPGTAASSLAPGQLMQDCPSSSSSSAM